MVKRALFLALFVALLGYVTPALAGQVYFNAAGAESVAAASCTPVANVSTDVTGVGNHHFVTRDCADDATRGFGWHFWYPADAATGATAFRLHCALYNKTASAGDIFLTGAIGCASVSGTSDYDTLTFGTAVTWTATMPGNLVTSYTDSAANIGPSGTAVINRLCFLRVFRTPSNAADTLTDNASITGCRLEY